MIATIHTNTPLLYGGMHQTTLSEAVNEASLSYASNTAALLFSFLHTLTTMCSPSELK